MENATKGAPAHGRNATGIWGISLENSPSLHWAGDIAILASMRAKMGDESNFSRIREVENIPKSQSSRRRRQIKVSTNSHNRNKRDTFRQHAPSVETN